MSPLYIREFARLYEARKCIHCGRFPRSGDAFVFDLHRDQIVWHGEPGDCPALEGPTTKQGRIR
jgi:hypothetical protein